jgi:hypothetical protein
MIEKGRNRRRAGQSVHQSTSETSLQFIPLNPKTKTIVVKQIPKIKH